VRKSTGGVEVELPSHLIFLDVILMEKVSEKE
jgi:hypothetical protein